MEPLAHPLAAGMAQVLADAEKPDLIVAVPLHWSRMRLRGFNQAAVLAAELSTRLDAALDNRILLRKRATPPQTGLTRAERIRNLRGVFQVRSKDAVRGRSILLVDDVLTTGATVDACARVLRAAGASKVSAVTAARAELEGVPQ
jgi:ComF family protein